MDVNRWPVWGRFFAGLAALLLLAGCASTISARVTTYEKWPADAPGQKYAVVPMPSQENNLEYQSFADMIRASIGRTGLVEANSPAQARFTVSFSYDNPMSQSWVQQFAEPYFPGPFFSPWAGYYGSPYGFGGGMFYSPPVINTPVTLFKNSLTVIIKDNERDGAEVYRSTAVLVTESDDLPAVMPYLTNAIFDGFPANNGSVRDISYTIK
ncbi:MAG: hypothetical protein CML16_08630 [Pusillimonas sp.]|jgi:hypothetical protein|nr:hypothetical protein [Pusillimonas sp.]MBC42310.1 hypothetical protein [Pusillimonas sp.]HCN70720.1 DUF4136 domain-containing protein [Pusillimonas sp.]HCP76681.1 DUF4136 domain-containing protein [Pusillimonas sp.]|tara:strand:- start:116857 stop:117489 length:633 start_codon:yes stop_codon:yes gene_type:complete